MESGAIPDDKITASTFKTGYEARKARLNRNSCWMPMQDRDTEYIKINFTSVTSVSAIATQGAPNDGCWVTSFSLQWFVNNQIVTDRKVQNIAYQNRCFFSLLVAGDVSRGGTSATQRQKFHTDDANQCLLNKSGRRGVPNVNLFNFRFLLIDFGKVLCSSANELQQNSNASSREDYIPQILTVLLEILRVYI